MTPTARYPEPNVVRFVRWFFAKPGRVLDIGSGSGNHARFFEDEGWNVVTVDANRSSRAHYHMDIQRAAFDFAEFDLILDHNTLCHVERPPYKEIYGWLAPGGWFLCVHPAAGTWEGVAEGKERTLFATRRDMQMMMSAFDGASIEMAVYPDFRGHMIQSWIAWGHK